MGEYVAVSLSNHPSDVTRWNPLPSHLPPPSRSNSHPASQKTDHPNDPSDDPKKHPGAAMPVPLATQRDRHEPTWTHSTMH